MLKWLWEKKAYIPYRIVSERCLEDHAVIAWMQEKGYRIRDGVFVQNSDAWALLAREALGTELDEYILEKLVDFDLNG